MKAQIVLLPGDGIGPEVVDAAADTLQAIGQSFDHEFHLQRFLIGAAALRAGEPPLPKDTLKACLAADAVFLGAVGDPEFDVGPSERRPETALLQLRSELKVYANLRPARVWPGLENSSSLKPKVLAGTDLLVVRELTGGLYYGNPRGIASDGQSAFNTMRYTRQEIEAIAEIAFQQAMVRRQHVTSVDKANVLETSRLWRQVVTEVGERYPEVRLDHQYVDSCAFLLASDPKRFDVLVAGNLFGDIISDEAGAIVGSLGLLPSASLSGQGGLFEPVHGSAPDIAGQDIANPVGAIASVALLLRCALQAEKEASAVEKAIEDVLKAGYRTADLEATPGRSSVSCSDMAGAIVERICVGTTKP